MKHIAIFVSGSGSNCENIIRYFANSKDIRPALVVSNTEKAYALTRAKNLGVPIVVLNREACKNQAEVLALLADYKIDYIILAGFLLMAPNYLIEAYKDRIINLHPALLPKYGGKGMYGHHVHEAVHAAGEKETGITIHHVSPVCDGGDIIAQFHTRLTPNDTPETIAEKIHILEIAHRPHVIKTYILSHAQS